MDILLEHLGKGIYYIILISMPIVLVAAGIGLVVGIIQAVTQVQEQTIAAAPKILGVFLVLLLGGTLIMQILNDYLKESVNVAFEVIPQSDNKAAPKEDLNNPDYIKKNFYNDNKFKYKKENPNLKEMMSKPMDSPYLKNNNNKQPTVYSPTQPIPDANIAEQIQNYKNMQNSPNQLKSIPPLDQKAPTIPPISNRKGKPTIASLPILDDPPEVNPSQLKISPKIASNIYQNKNITGAAAIIDNGSNQKIDPKPKRSTIIINSNDTGNITMNSSIIKETKKNKGSIILEVE